MTELKALVLIAEELSSVPAILAEDTIHRLLSSFIRAFLAGVPEAQDSEESTANIKLSEHSFLLLLSLLINYLSKRLIHFQLN